MDFKLNRETFTTNEVVLDTSFEQAVELDMILPDYFPNIFRIMKCKFEPHINSYSVNNNKLNFELCVLIKIYYLTEGSNALNFVEQKAIFTKSYDLTCDAINPEIIFNATTDYVNCRVVNQRRLDIRGAVSTTFKITSEKKADLITDAFGGNIQLKKEYLTYPSKRLVATKKVNVVESLEVSNSKPSIKAIIRSNSEILSHEEKIISGKLLTKGEAEISMLYTCEADGEPSVEAMKFSLPFSQVIDIDGISENFDTFTEITPLSCELITKNTSEEVREVECELVLLISIVAIKYDSSEFAVDAYSTCHQCDYKLTDSKLLGKPEKFNTKLQEKATLTYQEGEIACIYDIWHNVLKVSSVVNPDSDEFTVKGAFEVCVIGKNYEGCPIYLESIINFEQRISLEKSPCCYASINPHAKILTLNYNLISSNAVEVKADVCVFGEIITAQPQSIICEINVNEDAQKVLCSDYALKLYFATKGEEVWDIAKRFSTSVKAIIDENELSQEVIKEQGMILIPMIS